MLISEQESVYLLPTMEILLSALTVDLMVFSSASVLSVILSRL